MNNIKEFIESKETEVFRFVPNDVFYKRTGINRKRWGLIYRGEIEPTISEIERISMFFKVHASELVDWNKNSGICQTR